MEIRYTRICHIMTQKHCFHVVLGSFLVLGLIYIHRVSNVQWKGLPTDNLFIPEEFKPYLWRSANNQQDRMDGRNDRLSAQWEWVVNVSQSSYMKTAKRKRVLVTRGFNLDDTEKQLICHHPLVNFSNYCELIEDNFYDPRYHNYDEFDAVIGRRDWNYQLYEPRLPPSKISILQILETPFVALHADFTVNNAIIASYWLGSDIPTPYYKWVPYKNDTLRYTIKSNELSTKNYAEGKTKLAAVVVSHCPTRNNRLGYIHELQKYIQVDVYGDCGSLNCDLTKSNYTGRRPPREICFKMIEKNYKFYLAFENANCRDYITEKFFLNALQYDILPVVLGAHPDDYKIAAPQNSYIHVEDFLSPKHLAEYLLILDQNDTLYNEYFQWKGTGEFFNGNDDMFCRFCAMLFYADFQPPPSWPANSNWRSITQCLSDNKFYWTREN